MEQAVAGVSGRRRTTPSFAPGWRPAGGRDHHLTQPGGSWLRFTQIAIAAGRGDPVAIKGTLSGRRRIVSPVVSASGR
jgi:hypothetical protein